MADGGHEPDAALIRPGDSTFNTSSVMSSCCGAPAVNFIRCIKDRGKNFGSRAVSDFF
jgi:hypothetical protein